MLLPTAPPNREPVQVYLGHKDRELLEQVETRSRPPSFLAPWVSGSSGSTITTSPSRTRWVSSW